MNTNNVLDNLSQFDPDLTPEMQQRLRKKVAQMLAYTPRIGVLGKTGVGKSSLCNALFGQEVCAVSDVEACTRNAQDVLLQMGAGKGINLVDVPGVGEDRERDDEYTSLYQSLLPKLDVVLWVLKGDDRAYSVDHTFYQEQVKPYLAQGKPFIMVVNQVDKIEPFREWDVQQRRPGEKQAKNIEAKRKHVADLFGLKMSQVVMVSAEEKFGLAGLVDEIVFSLPDDQKLSLAAKVKPENLSAAAKAEVKRSFSTILSDTAKGAAAGAAAGAVFGPAGKVIGGIVGGICGLFGW